MADPCWKQVFDAEELQEIQQHKSKPLPPIAEGSSAALAFQPAAYTTYLNEGFPARSINLILIGQSGTFWTSYPRAVGKLLQDLRQMVSAVGLLWYAGTLSKYHLRKLKVSILTIRSDQQLLAGCARCNENRIAKDGSLKPKVLALKPDMVLAKEQLGYAAAENGFSDEGGVGSRELNEELLKLPKTMKDMLLRLMANVDFDEETIRKLQVVGLSHTHLRMTAMVMDAPEGYICRIKKLKEQQIASSIKDESFSDTYIRFIEQVLRLKAVIKSTMDTIKAYHSSMVDEDCTDYAKNSDADYSPAGIQIFTAGSIFAK